MPRRSLPRYSVVGGWSCKAAALILTANGCGSERCVHSGRPEVGRLEFEIFDIFKAVLKSAASCRLQRII